MRLQVVTPLLLVVVSVIRKSDAFQGSAMTTTTCPLTGPPGEACPRGCYQVSGGKDAKGTRSCQPVGVGNYSPANDNQRYPCEFGTFSAIETARACRSCPAGTYSSSSGASRCDSCPNSTYANLPRSVFCSPCHPDHYGGEGANAIEVWNGKIYCALIVAETESPTPAMTDTLESSSSHLPTDEQSTQNSGTLVNETMVLFESPEDLSNEDELCMESEYEWHGECTECPSTLRTVLYPIWLAFFIVGMVVMVSVLPASSTALLWMGVEYLQLVYFLGLVPSASASASSHQDLPLLEHLHRWILSIFVLDLDAGLSWQCMLGLMPSVDQMFVILFPMTISCSVWILSQAIPAIRANCVLVVAFSLGHLKFLLTALEALHCDGTTWFCQDPLLSFVVGVIGIVFYGCMVPFWLLYKRYSHSNPSEQDAWSRDVLAFGDCWWWPGFWMVRRSLLAILSVVLSGHPSWILTAFFVILMASELMQRFAAPFGACEDKNRWVRTTTVDTILQASIIGLTGLKFLAVTVSPETIDGDGMVIVVMFLAILTSSVAYWMAVIVYNYIQSRQMVGTEDVTSLDDDKSRTSASTTSSHHRTRNLPAPPSLHNITATSSGSAFKRNSDDADLQRNLSLVPHLGSEDDMDIETIMAEDEEPDGNLSEEHLVGMQYSEWAGTSTSGRGSLLLSHPVDSSTSSQTDLDDFLPQSSLQSGEREQGSFPFSRPPPPPPPPPLLYDFEDASTLTDNNSYVHNRKHQLHYYRVRPRPLNCPEFLDRDGGGGGGTSLGGSSSGEEKTTIFADDDETPPPVEYHIPQQYHKGGLQHHQQHHQHHQHEDDDDDMTEVWIDEATGMRVTNKQSGEWADSRTGLPLDTVSSSSSSSTSSSLPSFPPRGQQTQSSRWYRKRTV